MKYAGTKHRVSFAHLLCGRTSVQWEARVRRPLCYRSVIVLPRPPPFTGGAAQTAANTALTQGGAAAAFAKAHQDRSVVEVFHRRTSRRPALGRPRLSARGRLVANAGSLITTAVWPPNGARRWALELEQRPSFAVPCRHASLLMGGPCTGVALVVGLTGPNPSTTERGDQFQGLRPSGQKPANDLFPVASCQSPWVAGSVWISA
ncbi:hypothetical protein F5Y03DRAFT_390125 [Xylaria venustula]|nr:hypothetical protein F5Y03DRAFT_390125 [Xylaria venustula]